MQQMNKTTTSPRFRTDRNYRAHAAQSHRIMPSISPDKYDQRIRFGVAPETENEMNDTRDPLIVTDRARYSGNACIVLDGTGDYISGPPIGTVCTDNIIQCYINLRTHDATRSVILSGRSSIDPGTGPHLAVTSAGNLNLFSGGGLATANNTLTDIALNTWYCVSVSWNATSCTYETTNLETGAVATNTLPIVLPVSFIAGQDLYWGRLTNASAFYFDGFMSGAKIICDSTIDRFYPLAETIDDFALTKVYDASGSARDGTIVTTSGLSTMRTSDYYAPAWNMMLGFSEVTT